MRYDKGFYEFLKTKKLIHLSHDYLLKVENDHETFPRFTEEDYTEDEIMYSFMQSKSFPTGYICRTEYDFRTLMRVKRYLTKELITELMLDDSIDLETYNNISSNFINIPHLLMKFSYNEIKEFFLQKSKKKRKHL